MNADAFPSFNSFSTHLSAMDPTIKVVGDVIVVDPMAAVQMLEQIEEIFLVHSVRKCLGALRLFRHQALDLHRSALPVD
jgi:hypothetical protein